MKGIGSSVVRWAAVAALATIPLLVAPALAADGEKDGKGSGQDSKETPVKETRPVVDATKVYLGQAASCKAPAVVDADRVYREIPAYKRILEKKLTEKDAEYPMLLLKATKQFRCAVEAVAKDGSYDLVAAVGAVTWEGHTIPDVTDAAVRKIQESAK